MLHQSTCIFPPKKRSRAEDTHFSHESDSWKISTSGDLKYGEVIETEKKEERWNKKKYEDVYTEDIKKS